MLAVQAVRRWPTVYSLSCEYSLWAGVNFPALFVMHPWLPGGMRPVPADAHGQAGARMPLWRTVRSWLKGPADVLHKQHEVQIVGWAGLELGHKVQVELPGLG